MPAGSSRKPLLLTGFLVDPLVVDPRRGHRHRASAGHHVPLLMGAVADHQPVPVLIDHIG